MTASKFFSKGAVGDLASRLLKRKPAVVETAVVVKEPEPTAAQQAEDEYGLTEVKGVGFLEDFRIYSKIPADRWANAESGFRTGARMTEVQNTNLAYTALNTGTLITGSAGLYSAISLAGTMSSVTTINVPTLSIIDQSNNRPVLDADVELPQLEESVEAGAVPEGTLLTPVQVLHELRRVPNTFSLMDIEKKIVLYKSILECVRSDSGGGIKNTLTDVQNRIRARVKYRDFQSVRQFFDQFQCTDDSAVADLLAKHTHLRIGPADDFIPEMPDDALEVMVKYTKRCVQVSERKPIFYLIAEAKDFKQKKEMRQKRDPILLVQAPFGFYWQILGAWGPELRFLEEL